MAGRQAVGIYFFSGRVLLSKVSKSVVYADECISGVLSMTVMIMKKKGKKKNNADETR